MNIELTQSEAMCLSEALNVAEKDVKGTCYESCVLPILNQIRDKVRKGGKNAKKR